MVHNESENISAEVKFDDVADLLPGNENVNIRVKVVRLWRVPAFFNHSETSSVEMVLIDHKVCLMYDVLIYVLIYIVYFV
jgi:hypothetical protein